MVQREAAVVESSVRCTCIVCPLVCDDIEITARGVERACGPGRTAILAELSCDQGSGSAGQPTRGEEIHYAARMLASARRVLVTGLAHATLEAITVACDLAETLGAAIDDGLPESTLVAGPVIARTGEVTAVWEELRDRADLVLFWHCDPASSHPRFIERFVSPVLADGIRRRTIALGTDRVIPETESHRHLPLARHLAVEATRVLGLRLAGRHAPLDDKPLSAACVVLEEAIRSARCVAIVTGPADPAGLEPWGVVQLVRTIAHEKPAFQVPLSNGLAEVEQFSSGANVAGARAACTWRYGAAGAIARADRMGGLFQPAESDARRLIERGEVDAILTLGRLPDASEQAIAARGETLSLVRIGARPGAMPRQANPTIHIPCASGSIATTGTVLREDGRLVVLEPHRTSMPPQMRDGQLRDGQLRDGQMRHGQMREVLLELLVAVQEALAMPAAGGRS